MSRIQATFSRLHKEGKKALIPYVTAGDPNLDMTVPLMHEIVKAGADLIELGVPFSDPMADGPVIQRASERALLHNTSSDDVLAMVKEFRTRDNDTPVILMGYLNPIEVCGYENFINKASAAGVDGLLIVDFPPEESQELVQFARARDVDTIYLLSPTTTEARIKMITEQASGFVYYVSLKGVTGSADLDVQTVKQRIDLIKSHTDLPVGVGFGIKDAQTASLLAEVADAIIVGSANVKLIEQGLENNLDNQSIIKNISELLSSIRQAINSK